jgi:EAL domain-containing protein (putative c-di-GMP-specific phosphodiesterase class I)
VGGAHQQCARGVALRAVPPADHAAAGPVDTGAHYELLLRMRDEQGQIIAPDVFIAAAERYGLTPSIDRWVITNAFRWLVSEADERERLAMCSINLSGQSLCDDKFLPFVIEQFERSGLDASKICFEITETAAIASYSQANRFINSLKELGCKFALDDFGTGLSSFGYLKHFPVDFLKIDGSFVKEILHDPIDREMVRSINEIGHLTGKKTIAEFVENKELITMLRGMGVDYAQGYGVGEPRRDAPAGQESRSRPAVVRRLSCLGAGGHGGVVPAPLDTAETFPIAAVGCGGGRHGPGPLVVAGLRRRPSPAVRHAGDVTRCRSGFSRDCKAIWNRG